MGVLTIVLAALLATGPAAAPAGPGRLDGVVVDASGAPVPGARVRLDAAGGAPQEVRTGLDGRFSFPAPPGEATIEADAPGFAGARVHVEGRRASDLRIVLAPAPLAESITVTPSPAGASLSTPAATSVITSAQLLTSAAGALDDALRSTPGFSLFRRSSSRTANPTAQGVTLRGLTGSGASRTLVLADGLPLNDPFGSWVYWDRVPQASIERVEIARGAAGDLYGPVALGGVIQVLTFPAARTRVRAVADLASRDAGRASLFLARPVGRWSVSAAGEARRSEAYVVAAADRGRVDVPARSADTTAFASLGYASGAWHAGIRGAAFTERRGNGTPAQVNSTSWRQLTGEAGGAAAGGVWAVRLAGGTQRYAQTFSAVSADRSTERLTTAQDIPTRFVQGSGEWIRSWGRTVALVGVQGRRVRSTVGQTRYPPAGPPIGPTAFGGTERGAAVYGRVTVPLADGVTVVAGVRGEHWSSTPLAASGAPAPAARTAGFVSPRVSVAWQTTRHLELRAAAYSAHRTPTLNELYRGFRVGNVVTAANPDLGPERLRGVEGGLLISAARASARVTGYWNRLDGAVTNVTLSVTPSLISRERQNADRIGAAGIEVELDVRPVPALQITGTAAAGSSRFLATSVAPELGGNRVPQVPAYQLALGVTWIGPGRLTLAMQARAVGRQFDDDQNHLPLRPFGTIDVFASRPVGRSLHAFVSVENLFDVEYDVGRTPIRTIGWPRTVHAGFRLFLP